MICRLIYRLEVLLAALYALVPDAAFPDGIVPAYAGAWVYDIIAAAERLLTALYQIWTC